MHSVLGPPAILGGCPMWILRAPTEHSVGHPLPVRGGGAVNKYAPLGAALVLGLLCSVGIPNETSATSEPPPATDIQLPLGEPYEVEREVFTVENLAPPVAEYAEPPEVPVTPETDMGRIFEWLMANLPPCAVEDHEDCAWNAAVQGNGQGRSFVNIDGVVFYSMMRTDAW